MLWCRAESLQTQTSDNRNAQGQDRGGISCLLAETSCIFQPLTTVNRSTQSFGTNISNCWLQQFDVVSLKKRNKVNNDSFEEDNVVSYAPTDSEGKKSPFIWNGHHTQLCHIWLPVPQGSPSS